ncbi:MAG: hypothetical protein KKB37_08115, partial [Alphaproteobacteria bacterium]|nr:hypothetical protein [Alphaproteobacteria bacterium]
MIVKKRAGVRISSSTLFGIAGGFFGILTVGLMINEQFAVATYPECSGRYGKLGIMRFEHGGGLPMQPAELQSRLGGLDWGVMQNVSISKHESLSNQAALTVMLPEGGTPDMATRQGPSGAGFRWQPGYLAKTESACISYSIRIPDTFQFSTGGTLPGLVGAPSIASGDGRDEFSARMRWLQKGRLGVQVVTPEHPRGIVLEIETASLTS